MANQQQGHQGPGWRGEEVEDAPGDSAERAAERAEGNAPVRADEEAQRRRAAEGTDSEPADERRRMPSGGSPDEKIAEAAEEHQAREVEGHRPPHGKL